jgi:hypothetical protein
MEKKMCEGLTGLLGVLVGGGITFLLQKFQFDRESEKQRTWDNARKLLLGQMLDDQKWDWRSLKTMSRVIGSSEHETSRLLIELAARGSTNDDGMWGYLKDHPLTDVQ